MFQIEQDTHILSKNYSQEMFPQTFIRNAESQFLGLHMFCGSFNKIVLLVSPVLVKKFLIKLIRDRLYIKLYKICGSSLYNKSMFHKVGFMYYC